MLKLELLKYNELRIKAKELGIKASGTKAELLARVEKALEPVKKEVTDVPDKVKGVSDTEIKDRLTYLGEGPLSGEYRFAEISGSIAAKSKEEAIEKANEIAEKHPNLLK